MSVLIRKRLRKAVEFDDPKDMSYHIIDRIEGSFVYTEQGKRYRQAMPLYVVSLLPV